MNKEKEPAFVNQLDGSLEFVPQWPLLLTLGFIFMVPCFFFGFTGALRQAGCVAEGGVCRDVCDEEFSAATENLIGAQKYAAATAAEGEREVCKSACMDVETQCTLEASLTFAVCFVLIGIFGCIASQVKVNYFVKKKLAQMEADIENETARVAKEMSEKAKRDQEGKKEGRNEAEEAKKRRKEQMQSESGGGSPKEGSQTIGGEMPATQTQAGLTSATSQSAFSDARSEGSYGASTVVSHGMTLEEVITGLRTAKKTRNSNKSFNPYRAQDGTTFSGSKEHLNKCPYCQCSFITIVAHDMGDQMITSSLRRCLVDWFVAVR
jgi:hypothetical protein